MPLYEYYCGDCGQEWEVLKLGTGEDAVICHDCRSTNVKRKPSTYRFKFAAPMWVEKVGDYQKRQEDRGVTPTLPNPREIM